ncbi:hypothetical protein OT109_08800 [Phycisphaeraceae bacterium D3-23]
MPGDGAIMTAVDPEQMPERESGDLTLNYARSMHSLFMPCGYLGYRRIEIEGVTDEQWSALLTAIERCRLAREALYPEISASLDERIDGFYDELSALHESDPAVNTELEELNKQVDELETERAAIHAGILYIQLFDAGTEFFSMWRDGPRQILRPGLRYNETIFSREAELRNGQTTYGLELSAETLRYEWWHCHRVTAIALLNENPMTGGEDGFSCEPEPAEVDAATICFVVMAGPDPHFYAEGENELGYYVVRPDGTIEAYALIEEYALNGAKLPEGDLETYPLPQQEPEPTE